MSTARRRFDDALLAFLQLPRDDQVVLLEIARRIVAGAPVDHAVEQLTGERAVPREWVEC